MRAAGDRIPVYVLACSLTAQLTLKSQTLQARLDETLGSLDGASEKLAETESRRQQLDTQVRGWTYSEKLAETESRRQQLDTQVRNWTLVFLSSLLDACCR